MSLSSASVDKVNLGAEHKRLMTCCKIFRAMARWHEAVVWSRRFEVKDLRCEMISVFLGRRDRVLERNRWIL
jgi:hypothetical protein